MFLCCCVVAAGFSKSLSKQMLVMKEGKVSHLLVNGSFSTSTKQCMKEKVRSSCLLCNSEGKLCILAQYATFSQLVNATITLQLE